MTDYFELYKMRMGVYGDTIRDARIKSTINFITTNFKDSPDYKLVKIGNDSLDSRIISTKNFNLKQLLFLPNQVVNIGDIIEFDNSDWLVLDYEFNDIISKAYVQLCNSIFKVQVGLEEEIINYDPMNRPIVDKTPIFYETSCVVESKLYINKFVEFDSQINLPDGRIIVMFPYNKCKNVTEGLTFSMYKDNYKIVDIDFTKVINDVGVVSIIADKVTE